mmetsp:Transcript_2865/g.5505  ORF Transcript_2865/g.5505 Transcript_2865/m.5505 type:complete len:865 (+) Transcript_2865:127-2721(+)
MSSDDGLELLTVGVTPIELLQEDSSNARAACDVECPAATSSCFDKENIPASTMQCLQAGGAKIGSPSWSMASNFEATITMDKLQVPSTGELEEDGPWPKAEDMKVLSTDLAPSSSEEPIWPLRERVHREMASSSEPPLWEAAAEPPSSARRRRRWAADMDFRIQLSPETFRSAERERDAVSSTLGADSPEACIKKEPRTLMANMDFCLEPSREASTRIAGMGQTASAGEGEMDGQSRFSSPQEDGANPRDEFSFAATARSAASLSSGASNAGAISSAASPGATSAADSVDSLSTSPTRSGKKEKAMQEAAVADVSTGDASTGDASNAEGSATADGSATDVASGSPSPMREGSSAPLLRRSRRSDMLSSDPACSTSTVSASHMVAVPVESLGFLERSKHWAEQREQRLQRLREMRQQVLCEKAGSTNSSTSRLRREPSPGQRRRSSPSPAVAAALQQNVSCGPASLFARGEAWRERKRLREKELREEAIRHEVSACTFRPETMQRGSGGVSTATAPSSTTPPATVTPDRARRLFERHMSWRQRLDDQCERRRSEQRLAAERELRELRDIRVGARRASSAEPAIRRSSSTQARMSSKASVDLVFSSLYERNCEWQRARDARVERLHDEELARILQPADRPEAAQLPTARSGHVRQQPAATPVGAGASTGTGSSQPVRASRAALLATAAAAASSSAPASAAPPPPSQAGGSSSSSQIAVHHASSGTPRMRAQGPECVPDEASPPDEHTQVLEQLQALRRCLVSSQSRNSGTWQRTIRVESARLSGAGAAPLRTRPAAETTPRANSAAAGNAARGRAWSPSTARCKAQAGQVTDNDRGRSVPPRSRDASPASRGSVRPSPRRSLPAGR